MRRMNVIRSYQHEMYSEGVDKVALEAVKTTKDFEDKMHKLAHGHYKF